MNRAILACLTILAVLLVGCTPSGENIARKVGNDQGTGGGSSAFVSADGAAPLVDAMTQKIITAQGPTIKRYAERYGFDWRLILALMKQESRFSHKAESRKGASGLMQIMPATQQDVAGQLDLEDLSHPENNIRGGIFYLRRLYQLFEGASEADRIKLTLAAYNAGVSRVYDAQEMAAYFHERPMQWSAVRDALPLLSKRFYTLHQNIWNQDRPKSGWFGGAKETVHYVDAVMDYYDEYRLVLN
jgi:membrane-bound lytic murein transglycosylase F